MRNWRRFASFDREQMKPEYLKAAAYGRTVIFHLNQRLSTATSTDPEPQQRARSSPSPPLDSSPGGQKSIHGSPNFSTSRWKYYLFIGKVVSFVFLWLGSESELRRSVHGQYRRQIQEVHQEGDRFLRVHGRGPISRRLIRRRTKLFCRSWRIFVGVGDEDGGVSSPESTFPSLYEEILANLDNLEVNPISSLDSLLVDLFQSEDAFGGDSSLMRHSAMDKFSKLKSQVSNAYEKIENKIDLLEKELKAITCDTQTDAHQGSLKSADDSASVLSRSSGGLSNGCKDFKDQQVKCIEESSLDDDELGPSGGLDEHDNVVEETVSAPLEKELLLNLGHYIACGGRTCACFQ